MATIRFWSNCKLSHLFKTSTAIPSRPMSSSPTNEHPPGLLKVLKNNPKRLKRIGFLNELFKSNGFELRIAGGAVRDIIRGKEPKDIDFATTARPEQSLQIVQKHEDLLRIIVTAAGQRHGTIAVKFKQAEIDFKRIKLSHNQNNRNDHKSGDSKPTKEKEEPEYDDESPYEITTLRCDKLTDGRHAEVEFINDWQTDAERRDLTINAMFLTLDDGRLVDYFNGESDLRNGVIKFVGDADKRVKEDFLRILRFFRFWSRYGQGKRPDDATLTVLRDNLSGLDQISGERIWQEIKKTLSHLPCYNVFEFMLKLKVFNYAGLLDENLSDYEAYMKQVLSEVKLVQDNIEQYCQEVLDPLRTANPVDSDIKKIEELIPVILFACAVQNDTLCLNAYKRVRFSNLERDTILYLIENRNKSVPLKALKFQLAMSPVPERPVVLQRIRAFLISRGSFEHINVLQQWQVPKFPVNGAAVAKAVRERHLPSSKTKDILEFAKLKWADGDYKSDTETLKQWMEQELDRLTKAVNNDKPD